MPKSRRQEVWERARGMCEYCRMPQAFDVLPFQLDHIRARKHSGPTTVADLCLACLACNAAKTSNVAGYDPVTDTLQPLFNPRRDQWNEHFVWRGPRLSGKTPVGRTTIEVLQVNRADRVEQRRLLIRAGVFPPAENA